MESIFEAKGSSLFSKFKFQSSRIIVLFKVDANIYLFILSEIFRIQPMVYILFGEYVIDK